MRSTRSPRHNLCHWDGLWCGGAEYLLCRPQPDEHFRKFAEYYSSRK